MKGLLRTQKSGSKTVAVIVLLAIALLIISCAPNAEEPILSPQLGPLLAAREAGEAVAALPTPTPVLLASLSEEQIYAGLPEDVAAALASADPGRAEAIALANGCVGCHSTDPNQTMTGPTWFQVGDRAAGRVPGESPAFYLHQSIVEPNVYIVPNYQPNLMPDNFDERLSTQDLADLIAFLLEQRQ
jgi:cytochrome c551/c552